MMLASGFMESVTKPTVSIQSKTSEIRQKNYKNNSHIIHCIVKTVLLCGKQNISLIGHRDESTNAEKIAELIDTEISRPRITGRQRQRANAESNNTEEYFRRNIAIPFCDFLKTEMAVRFKSEDRKGIPLLKLLPAQIIKLTSADDLVTNLMRWEDDLLTPSSLRDEILLWKRLWDGKNV
ncbi:unnamed protein product [Mytilus coruscus]|uniref:DUF4371 domain-containing protein n=1 Tax=Mytilus coruscus TaxID=42192 RepID=A0A6J8BLP0_MYTCO|nr:unnamed protein product [Mytilus coruscus]